MVWIFYFWCFDILGHCGPMQGLALPRKNLPVSIPLIYKPITPESMPPYIFLYQVLKSQTPSALNHPRVTYQQLGRPLSPEHTKTIPTMPPWTSSPVYPALSIPSHENKPQRLLPIFSFCLLALPQVACVVWHAPPSWEQQGTNYLWQLSPRGLAGP